MKLNDNQVSYGVCFTDHWTILNSYHTDASTVLGKLKLTSATDIKMPGPRDKTWITVWEWLKENLPNTSGKRKRIKPKRIKLNQRALQSGSRWDPTGVMEASQGPGPEGRGSQTQFIWSELPWSDRMGQPRKIPPDNPFHAWLKLKHSRNPCRPY